MATHLNIVVVEDNDDLRSLLCAGLQNAGHRVTGLSCAEALEDQSGVDHVDAFLIDINLPGEDGLSLARRVRRAHPLVGIIILSARSALDDKLQGYDDGADTRTATTCAHAGQRQHTGCRTCGHRRAGHHHLARQQLPTHVGRGGL